MTQDGFILSIKEKFNHIDDDIIEFIKSFLDDNASSCAEELYDFVLPLIDDGISENLENELKSICEEYDSKNAPDDTEESTIVNSGETVAVDTPVLMEKMDMYSAAAEYTIPKRIGDISLHSTKNRMQKELTVDKKKLEKAEAKLKKKQREEAFVDNYVDLKKYADFNALNLQSDPTLEKGKNKDIKIEDFDISFGGKSILTNATFSLNHGRRYGLIGRNGVGKSTLLRALVSRSIRGINKDGFIPEWLRILHVEQEIEGTDQSVVNSVLEADAYLTACRVREFQINSQLKELEESEDDEHKNKLSTELKDIWAKLEYMDAEKAPSRAASILSGLGFSTEDQKSPTKNFSGGWRMRIALARALFCRPTVLLCDEPTNHLDMNAVVWLENYLLSWPSTLLVVSHDRDFLDVVATDIIHMHNETLDYYRGNFSDFLSTRLERRKNEQREYDAQLQYREHLQSFIDKWRYNAKRAAQAQSKIKILEKLPPLNPPVDDGVEDKNLKFRWPDPDDKLSPPILMAQDVSFGYKSERIILKGISFNIDLDSRVAIVGANGSGKTTLLKLLIGELEPKLGIIQRHGRLRIAYFSQHHVDALEEDGEAGKYSVVGFLEKKFPGKTLEEYRNLLGRFGITGNTATQSIRTLSGGQKSRVVFAMMAVQNPHVLICDEITNHLDIMTIDSLTSALKLFKGAVLIVSHDARFIKQVCNELWVCSEGNLTKFTPRIPTENSGIIEYKKKILGDVSPS